MLSDKVAVLECKETQQDKFGEKDDIIVLMGNYDINKWKEQIDPAFDKPIKTCIKYLKEIEMLPNDGQIAIHDEYKEYILMNDNYLSVYNKEFKTEMLEFDKKVGLIAEDEGKIFLDIIYSIDSYNKFLKRGSKKSTPIKYILKIFKTYYLRFFILPRIILRTHALAKLAKGLPEEESKQYYINKINGFIKDIHTRPLCLFQKDFVAMMIALFIRLFSARLDERSETEDKKEETEKLKDHIVINHSIGILYSTLSQIAHQQEMGSLLDNINKGDDTSLFKAVTIDKSLVNYEPIKNRILQAQSDGDARFLNKLGKAIGKKPLEGIKLHGKTYAVLKLFWITEISRLTNNDLYCLLNACGLNPPEYPYGFEKFMQRYIRPKTKTKPPNPS